MKIVVRDDYRQASQVACDIVAYNLGLQPRVNLCLPTGKTPKYFYRLLAEQKCDFIRANLFQLDEFFGLDERDARSFASFLNKHLADRAGVPQINRLYMNRFPGIWKQPRIYDDKIKWLGGLDITVLGVGTDGHIAFCEPGTPFKSVTHVTRLSPEMIAHCKQAFPFLRGISKGVTCGIKTILSSKKILLLAFDAKKAEAIDRLVHKPADESFPASSLKRHPDITLILDKAAARKLIL